MLRVAVVSGAFAASLLLPGAALAQDNGNDWHFRTAAYVFMSDIDGKQTYPAAQDIHVDFSDLVKRTEFSFMGVFDGRYRRVGAFADIIYLDLGNEVEDTDRIGTGLGAGVPLPPGITADLALDMKAWIATFAGYYRIHEGETGSLDVLAGARMARTKTRLDFAFSAPFGPFVGPLQQDSVGNTVEDWDGIVGTRGRVNFGSKREWFALGYADIGTGDSKRTWQVFVGGGRRFGKFDAVIGWRKLGYRYDSESPLERLSYSGPLIGAGVSF
jgi:hypothetical protein